MLVDASDSKNQLDFIEERRLVQRNATPAIIIGHRKHQTITPGKEAFACQQRLRTPAIVVGHRIDQWRRVAIAKQAHPNAATRLAANDIEHMGSKSTHDGFREPLTRPRLI